MPRRLPQQPDEPLSGWHELFDAHGCGWIADLFQGLCFVGGLALMISAGCWIAFHLAMTGLRNAIQQTAPQTTQTARPAAP